MNTADFLRLILPSKGYYFLAIPQGKGYKHTAFIAPEALAAAALEASAAGRNAYMACASYQQPEYLGADGRKHWRTRENAAFVRTQWLDMDGDKATNVKDLIAFCTATELPRPNILVDSGNGIHVYWVFDRDLPVETWRQSAALFKSLAAHLNLAQQDTTRTADVSSVLRPAGTTNDKTHKGLGIKPVAVIGRVRHDPVSFTDWLRTLTNAQSKYGITPPKITADKTDWLRTLTNAQSKYGITPPKITADKTEGINNDLGGGLDEFPPTSAVIIAEHCAQLRFFRDYRGGGQAEPTWRNCLGIVKHCTEGESLAHHWSGGHPEYDAANCQQKLDSWTVGPTTCDRFKQDNAPVCERCPHTVATPMFLGRQAPEPVAQLAAFDPVTETIVLDEAPVFSAAMTQYFRPTERGICARFESEEGVITWNPICANWVYPYQYYKDLDDSGQWKVRIRERIRPGVWRESEVTAKSIGSGGSTLLGELTGKAMVVPTPGQGKKLENYMKTWIDELKSSMNETAMHEHMGWQPDRSFLVGAQRYAVDGTTSVVVLNKQLRNDQASYTPSGDLARYIELIDTAYNRPRHEAYQFTWMAGFASPLIELMCQEPVGIVFSAWSPESGFGKSTAAKLAAGIWHDPTKVVAANRTTEYALYVNAGYRRNLPLVVDEISSWDPAKLAQFGYDFSSGKAKDQGDKVGGLRDNAHLNWTNCAITTSNRSIMEIMSAHSANQCTPQMMRVFEYRFDAQHHETMSAEEGRAVISELMQIRGVAGPRFIRAVAGKQDVVRKLLDEAFSEFARESDLPKDARFWLYGAAACWVAFRITAKQGLHKFNATAYKTWIIARLKELKNTVHHAKTDAISLFGDMVSDLQGGMIVTMNEGHAGGTIATLAPNHRLPNGEVTGRLVIGDKRISIKTAAVKEWCKAHNVSVSEMKHALKLKGWLLGTGQVYLARGLPMAVAKTGAWTLDWSACIDNVRLATINGAPIHDEEAA
jgi:Domain of unknown function (DUF927)